MVIQLITDQATTTHKLITNATDHLFFGCPFARALWFESWGLRVDIQVDEPMLNWVDIFSDNANCISMDHKGKAIMAAAITMEEIWSCRNAKFRGERESPLHLVISCIKNLFWELKSVRSQPNDSDANLLEPPQVQDNPGEGVIFVNFDAAVREDFMVAACSFRDQEGSLVGLSTTKLRVSEPEVAEGQAAKFAISEAVRRG